MPRKRVLVFLALLVSAAAFFLWPAPPARAQSQEQARTDESLRQLQEQWRQIMKNEYNPAAVTPNRSAKPMFDRERERRGHPGSRPARQRSRRR